MKLRLFTIAILIFSLLLSACDDGEEPMLPDATLTQEGSAETFTPEPDTDATGGDAPAGAGEPGSPLALPTPDRSLAADLGFRPGVNGFGFENYGGDASVENLTAAELRRMFGDRVCASLKNDKCVLTPPAKQWMKQVNEAMAGGHCEGMAALSLLMYTDQVKESQYGGSTAAELPLNSNLAREIAYWWTTQAVAPTVTSLISGTPQQILDTLLAMQPGGETYTIGIYKRDGSGGHAITPYAVADQGDGKYVVLSYDNNYPGEVRELYIDAHANTWQYEAAINPQVESELYEGDAETMTLDLTPTSARLGQQVCPFCEGQGEQSGKGPGLAQVAPRYNEIFLEGDAHLLLTDDQGRVLGYKDGQYVNEIPGARMVRMRTADPLKDDPEPVYWLPQGTNATITLDGGALQEPSLSDLVLVGPGYTFGVEGILLQPNQVDTIYFAPEEGWLTFETDQSASPNIVIGIEKPEADFYFEIQGADMQGGGTINVMLDPKSGDLVINAEKLTNEGTFNLVLTRIDDELEQEFYADDLVLKANSLLYINYADWKGDGNGLLIGVDLDGDGEIDETYEAEDQ